MYTARKLKLGERTKKLMRKIRRWWRGEDPEENEDEDLSETPEGLVRKEGG